MTSHNASKTERLEARVPADLKALLRRAAAIQHQSLSDFVLGAAIAEGRRVIRAHELLEWTDRDQRAFAEAILHPPRANHALRRAARRYRGDHD